jgi:hypothetical protein
MGKADPFAGHQSIIIYGVCKIPPEFVSDVREVKQKGKGNDEVIQWENS